jgi:hypothetical protein
MKSWLQEFCFFLLMSLIWGIAVCFLFLGPIFIFIDWLTNTNLVKILDVYVLGYKSFSFVILCIIGMPLAWILRK